MFTLLDSHRYPSGRLTRRQWLQFGTLVGLGSIGGSTTTLSSEPAAALSKIPGFGRAKSVIVVFTSGGQSQIDLWDPKPNAPLDIRGDFKPISTAVTGIHFTEPLPQVAKIADRLTVLRSMSHQDVDHGSAVYLTLTGHYHAQRSGNPPPRREDLPTHGAVLQRVKAEQRQPKRFLYDAVHLNGPIQMPVLLAPGQNSGLLGRDYDPLVLGDVRSSNQILPGLAPQEEWSQVRLNSRLSLKEQLDAHARNLEQNQRALDLNRLYRQAYAMLATPAAREAFNLAAEADAVRDRYGRHRSGQACLLARRLVEVGVPYVNVIWNHANRGQDLTPDDTDQYGWDTHNDIFGSLKNRLMPRFDESFSALIEDLDERGLLETTLVICIGEFGRAPQIAVESKFKGSAPGRKHWATVYSAIFAGAGVQRGAIVGASDRLGAEPITDRFGPWDMAATIFHTLGIDPAGHFTDTLGRPFVICSGRPIRELYG
jgi:hypothetical protein